MFVFLQKLLYRNPLRLALWRVIQFPYPLRIALIELAMIAFTRVRPHYYSGLFESATLAHRLGVKRISAIEFGVAGGAGLVALERYAARVTRATSVEIDVFGFDMISGLPKPTDYRDMPYAWKEGFFKSDKEKLEKKLKRAIVIEGNISETLPKF
ncbi:MAG: hypothetical protein HQ495_09210 [Alphaproteobacteria bacterium]|nr:hypothetical protein [Alphaproteobacteria bacterium]